MDGDGDELLALFQDEISKVEQGAVAETKQGIEAAAQDTHTHSNTHPHKRFRPDGNHTQTIAVVAAASAQSLRRPDAHTSSYSSSSSSASASKQPSHSHLVSSVVASAKAEPVSTISINYPEAPQTYEYDYYQAALGGVEAATAHLESASMMHAQGTTAAKSASSSHAGNTTKKFVRSAGGETWEDDTLNQWPDNDFRLFVGDLGNEVSSEMLAKEFSGYPSYAMAKVIKNKGNNKSRGYGFVSFMDPFDAAKALREKNGKYIGHRPMKIRKGQWQERNLSEVKKKEKKKRKMNQALGLA